MNRVYKVIWNKVKGQYVVVSELVHRCTKSAGHTAGRRSAAMLTVLILVSGFGMNPVFAEEANVDALRAANRQEENGNNSHDEFVPISDGGASIDYFSGGNGKNGKLKFLDSRLGETVVALGSKVEVTNNDKERVSSITVNDIRYNVQDYAVNKVELDKNSGILTVTTGDKNGHGEDEIVATIDGFVTDDNIASKNNLSVKISENAGKDGGNWTITDKNQQDKDGNPLVLSNTTLDKEASKSIDITGSSEENKNIVYGKSYKVADTDGNVIELNDVASANKLMELDVNAVKYDNTDKTSITLGNVYNSEKKTGGTYITNVAYATGEDGSQAVNVDYLTDQLANVNSSWTAMDSEGNTATIGKDNSSLKFTGDENVDVAVNDTNNENTVTVSLKDDITLGEKGTNKNYVDLSGTNGTLGVSNVSKNGNEKNVHTAEFNQNGATFSKEEGIVGDDGIYSGKTTTTIIDGGTVTVVKGNEGTTIIDGATITTNKVTSLTNTEWSDTIANEVAADKAGAGTGAASIAATQGQLKDVADMAGNAADEAAKHTTIKRGDNNLDIIAGENNNGGIEYTISLKDTIQLGDIHTGVLINGESGIVSAANAIMIGDTTTLTNGKLIGLANVDWNPVQTRTGEEVYDPEQAATQGQLDDLYDSVVGYDVIGGKVNYSSITLGHGSEYKGSAGGGTHLYNVAYASGNYGSEAVNVDYLKDQIDNVKQEVTNADKHLATNSGANPDMADATYAPDENGNVTIKEVDGTGKPTGNEVVISDIASKNELDNVKEDVSDLQEDVGDLNYVDNESGKGNVVTNGDSVTEAIGDLDGAIGDLQDKVEEAHKEAGKHSTVSVGNGLELDKTEATDTAGADYKVSLADDFTLGAANGEHVTVEGSKGTISATGNISSGSFSTTDGISIGKNEDGKNVISGLQNLDWDATKDYSQSGIAATEAQLQKATEGAVQYDRNEDGAMDKTHVTFNKGGDSVTLQNVAKGDISENSTQAVNGAQLFETNQAVEMNRNSINMLSNSVHKLDNRIDRVGAGAAALAALHPLDFDPDAKWDFAAGYGNYRGASAVAMGAYYRPNEDVMLSVGGSMGGGENMVNAGVSIKLGAGSSHVSTSRVAMAKEIESLRGTVAQLTALVNTMVGSQHRIQNELSTEFPDVPENHWAYEAVETLAKSGLAVGYPDGQFKGDRSLTRYEFAEIVHRALQAGVGVDARLVEEFKPELEFFRIDTITTDADGNPVIQRVRVNK